MGSDERGLEEVLRLKKRRLLELEKKIARLGYSAPPELTTERDDLRHELDRDQQAIEPVIKGELSEDALAALRMYGIPAAVKAALQHLEQRFWELKRDFLDFRDMQSRLREKENTDRETRQQETDKQREHVNMRLIRIELYLRVIGGLIVVGAVVGGVALLLARLGLL